jgi:hypothetical protein
VPFTNSLELVSKDFFGFLAVSRDRFSDMHLVVVDCVWEFFVLVAKDARAKRPEIQLAISVASVCQPSHLSSFVTINVSWQRLSTHVAESRPYRPTVHVLVLPSQLPLEFRLNFRDIDEALLVSRTFV